MTRDEPGRVWTSAEYSVMTTVTKGTDPEAFDRGVHDEREVGVTWTEHGTDHGITLTGDAAAVKSALRRAIKDIDRRIKEEQQ